jgi:DNA-3-methyladenine glycosylase
VAEHRAGTAYVYFNYGMHWMLNVLVKGKRAGFVLFRGLEPTRGIEEMFAARRVKLPHQLASGPGKLAQALGVTGEHHGMDLCTDAAHAFHATTHRLVVREGPRIGISRAREFPWRFYADANRHVSAFRAKDKAG